ncbi:MAG: hypothetical protein GY930_19180 [bacterium]|nr:hypothetical protein [bacterium]
MQIPIENNESHGPATADGTTVVVDGTWRQSLTVVRSLGRAGYRVVVVRTPGSSYLEKSRYVSGTVTLRSGLDGGLSRIEEIVEQLGGAAGTIVYYPIGDTEIRFALDQRDHFPANWCVAMAPSEVVELCADKTRAGLCTETAGVPGIRTIPVKSLTELKAAADTIGFPCLVKGNSEAIRHNRRKAIILKGANEIDSTFAGWAGGDQKMLVQTYCAGPRYNVYFFAHEGKVLVTGSLRAVRTDMADGTGLAVEGISVETTDELREYTANLAREMGYHGTGCAQYLLNEAGEQPVFLEINARLGANFGAVYCAGLNLPLLSVKSALGQDVTPYLGEGVPAGRRYSWFYGDLAGCIRSFRRRQVGPLGALTWLGKAVGALFGADDHITWDRDDPRPTLEIWKQRLLPWRREATL